MKNNETQNTCPIWGTQVETRNDPERKGTVVDSPRTDGKYFISKQAIELVKALDDTQKTRLTSWLINQRSSSNKCPEIDEDRVNQEASGQALETDERANRLLKLIKLRSSGIGIDISFAYGDSRMLAWSESTKMQEVLSLLDHLENRGWIKKDLHFDGGYVSITTEGQIHLEKSSKATTNPSKALVAVYFDKAVSEALIEPIEKAKKKLAEGDYDGAITNCRTLVEELLKELLGKTNTPYKKNEGDIKKLYKQLVAPLNLNPQGESLGSYLKPILQGLQQQIDGLYHFANKAGDRHSKLYKPSKHHAQLTVNVALTLCQFLLESYKYEKEHNQSSIVKD